MNKQKLEKLATVNIYCYSEDTQILGNASAIDEVTDREVSDRIVRQLEQGNEWAWCMVQVTAEYAGTIGAAWLGCCSYDSEADFMACAYYPDMISEALDNLIEALEETLQEIKEVK